MARGFKLGGGLGGKGLLFGYSCSAFKLGRWSVCNIQHGLMNYDPKGLCISLNYIAKEPRKAMPAHNSPLFLNHHYMVLTQQMLSKAGVPLGPYGNRGQAIGPVAGIQPMITFITCKSENRGMAIKKADGFAKWKMS